MDKRPTVSVIVACKNVAPYISHALKSVLNQSLSLVEIIVVDDGSTDGTLSILTDLSGQHSNIQVYQGGGNGPAGARNMAISKARGDWVAILDGDDLFHPHRLAHLLEVANLQDADVIGDGLMAFTEEATARDAWRFFPETVFNCGCVIELKHLFAKSKNGLESPLGYLKPMIRREFLSQSAVIYNEALYIGEDFDFLARLLAEGARVALTALPLYFYRRHASSISFRLDPTNADKMLEAAMLFAARYEHQVPGTVVGPMFARLKRLKVQKFTQHIIHALKARALAPSIKAAVSCPEAAFRAVYFILEGQLRRIRSLIPRLAPRDLASVDQEMPPVWPAPKSRQGIELACKLFSTSKRSALGSDAAPIPPYWRGFVWPNTTFDAL